MKLSSLVGVVVVLIAAGTGLLTGCGKHAAEKQAIQNRWESYRAAAESGDGQAAANMLSKNTLDMYSRLLKVALDAPAAECWKLKASEMYEVAGMRTNYKRSELKSVNGKGYVLLAISRGHWATFDDEWKLRDIVVNETKDSATAVICHPAAEAEYRNKRIVGSLSRSGRRMSRNIEKPPTWAAVFVKEGDEWKYDETATLVGMDQDLLAAAKAERMNPRDYVSVLATGEDDVKTALKVWNPMPK